MVNEVRKRKSSAKAKLKATSKKNKKKNEYNYGNNISRIYSETPRKLHMKPITRIISKQFDIKLGQFMQEELDSVFRKKNRKAAVLELLQEVWKTKEFDGVVLRQYNDVYNQNTIDRSTMECILPFPKKGDLGLAKNYRGITLTSITAKIYNALLRNRIEPKIDCTLRKNRMAFGEIDPWRHKFWLFVEVLKKNAQKKKT